MVIRPIYGNIVRDYPITVTVIQPPTPWYMQPLFTSIIVLIVIRAIITITLTRKRGKKIGSITVTICPRCKSEKHHRI